MIFYLGDCSIKNHLCFVDKRREEERLRVKGDLGLYQGSQIVFSGDSGEQSDDN